MAQQKSDRFCKNKVKHLYQQQKLDFKLDNKGILRKLVHLHHNWESTIVIPKSLINNIIYEYNKCIGHQGITRTVNMVCRYFWWPGMRQSIYQHIGTCKLCVQFLPNKISTRPMHLEIPQVPFAGCAVDTIGLLPMMSKGNKYALTFTCLLTYYLIAVPLSQKLLKKLPWLILNTYHPAHLVAHSFYRITVQSLKNNQLVATFKLLGIKPIYSNPNRPQGNSRLENAHNFLKHTISKFLLNSTLEWDDILPIAAYIYNIAPTVNDLETPFFLVFGRGQLEGRLSHLQNYCRHLGTEPGKLAVEKLKCMWRLHAELLHDSREKKNPVEERKFDKASDLKIGQLVLIKIHTVSAFQPKYLADHRVIKIVNNSTVIVSSPGGKEKKCHIHYVNPISPTTAFTSAFEKFQKSITKEGQKLNTVKQRHYNLRSQSKEKDGTKY